MSNKREDKMKILYVSTDFPPLNTSASIRNLSLVNGLVNYSNVDVLTLEVPNFLKDITLEKYLSKSVKVYRDKLGKILSRYYKIKSKRVNSCYINSNSKNYNINLEKLLRTLVKEVYFVPDIYKEWINGLNYNFIINKNYDLIISSSDAKTSHFVTMKIHSYYKKKYLPVKWFQIWGDPWSEDISLSRYKRFIASLKQKSILNKADRIYYVSLPSTNKMKHKYPEISRNIDCIGRSYVKEIKSNNVGKKSYNNINITYTGGLTRHRDISNLLNAIIKYNKYNNNNIILNIYGPVDSKTASIISEYRDIINYYHTVNFANVLKAMQASNILLFISNDNSHQIPGKIYDYFSTEKHIFAIIDENSIEVNKFLKSTKRCIISKNCFLNIYEKMKILIENLDKQEKPLVQYSPKNVAYKIIKDYNNFNKSDKDAYS